MSSSPSLTPILNETETLSRPVLRLWLDSVSEVLDDNSSTALTVGANSGSSSQSLTAEEIKHAGLLSQKLQKSLKNPTARARLINWAGEEFVLLNKKQDFDEKLNMNFSATYTLVVHTNENAAQVIF